MIADVDLPLFEDDLTAPGVLEPATVLVGLHVEDMPEVAVLCFFPEVVEVLAASGARRICRLSSERGRTPVWETEVDGQRLAVMQPGVGAPLAVMFFEELIALGCRRFVAVGGAGALLHDLTLGHAIVVESAVRDEGTSFHYLPPGRTVDADTHGVEVLSRVLDAAEVPYRVARTWTTDAIYRETRSRVERRQAEGCAVVEMEASAFIAVARYRGVRFAQLLLAADSLAGEAWDRRGWTTAHEAREGLFRLAAQAALAL
jgi:uridine phosphorylase